MGEGVGGGVRARENAVTDERANASRSR
jgi:hypothetical protein